MSDLYSKSSLMPPIPSDDVSGPLGPAYVQVFDNDRTSPGWGETTFMEKYLKRTFHGRRAQVIYDRHSLPFALVMRSMRMVCIDIDGKNNGNVGAVGLLLPPTLAETSKSGNGHHLFYLVDDTWDARYGFNAVRDRIGFVEGVDVRGTGCVYHYPQQQWNNRVPVQLPEHVLDKLNERASTLEASIQRIKQTLDAADDEEILMMQDHVTSRLTAPIPQGRRNNTLFAIGAEMCQAQVPGWEKQVYDRAVEVGLTDEEATKIVANVRRYG
jgi:hypothetical protein